MVCIIHGKKKIRATATANILGINVNVISLMDVAAWKMLTSNPTARPASSIGAAKAIAVLMASKKKPRYKFRCHITSYELRVRGCVLPVKSYELRIYKMIKFLIPTPQHETRNKKKFISNARYLIYLWQVSHKPLH